MITYEYPLNERVRTWLRFDRLFEKYRLAITDNTSNLWPLYAVQTLMEISDVADRSDLKSDMLKELARLQTYYDAIKNHDDVDSKKITQFSQECEIALNLLRAMPGRPSQLLNNNPWFNLIRSRLGIPGGCNDFDVPSFHWWRNLPAERKNHDVEMFFNIFAPLETAIKIILFNIRQSYHEQEYETNDGTISLVNNNKSVLIQVKIADDCEYYPEVGANRFQINIRLLKINFEKWESIKMTGGQKVNIVQCISLSDLVYN